MVRFACGSLLVVLVIPSSALAQTLASCDDVQTVEVTVWRGSEDGDRTLVPERICSRGTAPDGTLPVADPLVPTEWGIPGLEEITALVLASSQLPGPSQPDRSGGLPVIFGSTVGDSPIPLLRHAVRAVVVAPGTAGEVERILHLMIYKANPNRLELDVHTGAQRPIRLSRTRRTNSSGWVAGARPAL